MLEEINKVIVERLGREYQIGHSYLMKEDLDNNALIMTEHLPLVPVLCETKESVLFKLN